MDFYEKQKHQIKLSCPAIKYLINVFYISKMAVDTQQSRKNKRWLLISTRILYFIGTYMQ